MLWLLRGGALRADKVGLACTLSFEAILRREGVGSLCPLTRRLMKAQLVTLPCTVLPLPPRGIMEVWGSDPSQNTHHRQLTLSEHSQARHCASPAHPSLEGVWGGMGRAGLCDAGSAAHPRASVSSSVTQRAPLQVAGNISMSRYTKTQPRGCSTEGSLVPDS